MRANPFIEDGMNRLRTKWPQTHCEPSSNGAHLIIVPGVTLPDGWDKSICTLLFIAPPGFPGAMPADFFTDIAVRLLADYPWPENTHEGRLGDGGNFPAQQWPQWVACMWWRWRLQAWDPNRDSLYTFAQSCRRRLAYVH